jgi:hypothetical protein
MNYKNYDGIIDTRDLEEHLKDLKKTESPDDDDKEYIEKIEQLKQELGSNAFDDGVTLIEESEFQDYAKELAYECGHLSGSPYCSNPNPLDYFINWEEWADHCKIDYSDVEFDEKTYYYLY